MEEVYYYYFKWIQNVLNRSSGSARPTPQKRYFGEPVSHFTNVIKAKHWGELKSTGAKWENHTKDSWRVHNIFYASSLMPIYPLLVQGLPTRRGIPPKGNFVVSGGPVTTDWQTQNCWNIDLLSYLAQVIPIWPAQNIGAVLMPNSI